MKCRLCNSKTLITFCDLGQTPLADNFLDTANQEEKTYRLKAVVCSKCFLVQLEDTVSEKELFNPNYGFFTEGSPSLIKHFEDYAKEIIAVQKSKNKFVVEIASNDGTLLEHFVKAGFNCLGIEPTANTAIKAQKKGVGTLVEFFDLEVARIVAKERGQADIIMANNVLAHVENINGFVKGIKELLAPDGIFVCEVQYFPELLFKLLFDNIYHEHHSFFSLIALTRLIYDNDLVITDIEEIDTQGGSVRLYIKHTGKASDKYHEMLEREFKWKLHDINTYMGFQPRIDYAKYKLLELLKKLKKQKKTIYGYGASAKSTTLLNYFGIDGRYLDYVVDKTPYKFGKYTPGTRVPIVEQDKVKEPDYYLALVWNYLDDIMKREVEFRNGGGHFLVPFPMPKIL